MEDVFRDCSMDRGKNGGWWRLEESVRMPWKDV